MAESKEAIKFQFEAEPVRFLWGFLIKPGISDYGNGRKSKLHFEGQFGISPDNPDLVALKKLMAQVAKREFGTVENVSFPLKDGTVMADKGKAKTPPKDRERARGLVVFKASTSADYPPALCYVSDGTVVDVQEDIRASCTKFYPGVECAPGVTLKAYPGNDEGIKNSVKAYLSMVCSTGRGKNLGGGVAKKFAGFAKNIGTVSDEDPTDDGADIPM